uniref:Translation initiation factor IF-2-like n=1 Tax=Tursiops truncatus TaxID=9739 RepID=A0A6J3Q8P0_TURTR|nr:translation initiation factor IF-2-like [Tursiops truncatus]
MTPSSGNRTPVMPFSLQEMLSSAPHPTPLRQEPKAPCFSEPACGSRPPGSDPRLGLGTDRAERVHPSSRRPSPHPPRRRLPRRLPALAQSRPGSQRASGALWDGTRRKRRKRRQRQHLGLLPWLPRAIPEESRGSRSGEEASDEDPGVCAPVSLPRRRRWLQVSGARSPRGPAWPRSPEAQTDRRTDRAWAPTHAGAPKGPRPGPCGPSRRTPPPALGPWLPTPRGRGREGGRRCGTPRPGPVGPPWPGELRELPEPGAARGSHPAAPRGGAVPRRGAAQTWPPPTPGKGDLLSGDAA